MATFVLSEHYGSPHNMNNFVKFSIELDADEEQRLRDFLKENGPCDYCYLEGEHSDLFDLINDAASDAVEADIRERFKCDGDEEDDEPINIDWGCICYDFYWDDRLLQ